LYFFLEIRNLLIICDQIAFFNFFKVHHIKILWHFGGHPWQPNLNIHEFLGKNSNTHQENSRVKYISSELSGTRTCPVFANSWLRRVPGNFDASIRPCIFFNLNPIFDHFWTSTQILLRPKYYFDQNCISTCSRPIRNPNAKNVEVQRSKYTNRSRAVELLWAIRPGTEEYKYIIFHAVHRINASTEVQ